MGGAKWHLIPLIQSIHDKQTSTPSRYSGKGSSGRQQHHRVRPPLLRLFSRNAVCRNGASTVYSDKKIVQNMPFVSLSAIIEPLNRAEALFRH
jgi:hypothetical protein